MDSTSPSMDNVSWHVVGMAVADNTCIYRDLSTESFKAYFYEYFIQDMEVLGVVKMMIKVQYG